VCFVPKQINYFEVFLEKNVTVLIELKNSAEDQLLSCDTCSDTSVPLIRLPEHAMLKNE
jgi:hypothetical protein